MPSRKLTILSVFCVLAIIVMAGLWVDQPATTISWSNDWHLAMAVETQGYLCISYMQDTTGHLAIHGLDIQRAAEQEPLWFDNSRMFDFLGLSMHMVDFPVQSIPRIRGFTFTCPKWLAIILLSIAPVTWISKRLRHRIPESHCPECGYDIRHTSDACPECGKSLTTT